MTNSKFNQSAEVKKVLSKKNLQKEFCDLVQQINLSRGFEFEDETLIG